MRGERYETVFGIPLATLFHALLVAKRLAMEPSEGMLLACAETLDMPGFPMTDRDRQDYAAGFKAMRAQLYREVEGDLK